MDSILLAILSIIATLGITGVLYTVILVHKRQRTALRALKRNSEAWDTLETQIDKAHLLVAVAVSKSSVEQVRAKVEGSDVEPWPYTHPVRDCGVF